MLVRPHVAGLTDHGTTTLTTTEEPAQAPAPVSARLAAAREAHAAERILPPQRHEIGKRSFDLLLCVPILLLTLPISLPISLAIKLDSRGPVLYRQTRIGKDGQPFVMYKFRSMWQTPPGTVDLTHQRIVDKWMAGVPLLPAEQIGDPPAKLVSDTPRRSSRHLAFKAKDDPRVTRVGRLLRRTSLDELPQVLNVCCSAR